jgi:hypothetical protein
MEERITNLEKTIESLLKEIELMQTEILELNLLVEELSSGNQE